MKPMKSDDQTETMAIKAPKAKKVLPPLDPSTLGEAASEHLAKGADAKAKLEAAAELVEIFGLSGMAKHLRAIAERAYKVTEREVRKIERQAKVKAKKQERIAKLQKQLKKLVAEEAISQIQGADRSEQEI